MADQIGLQHSTAAANLYAIIRDADGAVWNGSTFESYVTANLGTYDVPMTEQGTASRYYTVAVPALAAGRYTVTAFVRAGGSPAETDSPVGGEHGEWDGTRWTRLGDPAGVSLAADIIAMKAETATIVADTNELQTDWVNGGRLDLLIDAIKAKTDNLPADPADASDIAAGLAALNDLSAAEVNAEMVDALATDTYTEITGVPGFTVPLTTMIRRMYAALINPVAVSSTKKTFKSAAGVAQWEKDLADDGTDYTESSGNAP